jgi:hypothetical protein
MKELNSLAREIALSACIERLRSESGRVEIDGVEWRDINVAVNGVPLGSLLKKELLYLKLHNDLILSASFAGRVGTTNLDRPIIPLENFAVRTHSHKPQCKLVRLFVDEQQIGLQMALAVVGIFARQRMIVKSFRQGLIRRQE